MKDWFWSLLIVGGFMLVMNYFITEGAKLDSWPPVVFLSVLAVCVTAVILGGLWFYTNTFEDDE